MCRMSWKSGSLNLLETCGPHLACYATALPLPSLPSMCTAYLESLKTFFSSLRHAWLRRTQHIPYPITEDRDRRVIVTSVKGGIRTGYSIQVNRDRASADMPEKIWATHNSARCEDDTHCAETQWVFVFVTAAAFVLQMAQTTRVVSHVSSPRLPLLMHFEQNPVLFYLHF